MTDADGPVAERAVAERAVAERAFAERGTDDATRAQRRRSAALVIAVVVVAATGAIARAPWPGADDVAVPCSAPALRDGVLVCDGNGARPGAKAWLAGQKLDVNQATARELELIPDVGPSLARAIVDERARRGGRFATYDELDDVDGIGPKTLEKLRVWLMVE